jgi:hypothetical protein
MEIIKQMKLLVNDKELAHYLISLIDLKDHCAHIELNEVRTAEAIQFIIQKRDHHKFDIEKYRDKFKEKLVRGISADIEGWRRKVDTVLSNYRKNYFGQVHKRAEYVIEKLGAEKVIDAYMNSDQQYFIKTVGQQIDPTATMIRRRDFSNSIEDCLLRNTVGNEHIIVDKIDNNLPFWFIDSGYTNFIEPNKKWHRLVRNHLHFNRNFVAPADRLDIFPSFPRPWRRNGSKILIVEPGEFAAGIMHVEAKSWGQKVADELKKYTDRPVEFRSKTNKKTRTSLYQQLVTGDYYCTVSINSNSAVESIWAGVPAITLNRHVSNAVTRNSLSQINDLYYGPLGDWLAWLSYCQFTFEELMDGTALDIIRKYHSV